MRKLKTANKRYSRVNESLDKDVVDANRDRLRKKLLHKSGSQWTNEEIRLFYEAYREYGKNWKKVASILHNRSEGMVEALYNMNRAYLSLPEGIASVTGLIAMVIDHYNMLEDSENEQESNDKPFTTKKPQKHGRAKSQLAVSKGLNGALMNLSKCQPDSSNIGCLSLLRSRHSGGTHPHPVRKRTPRFPFSYSPSKDDKANNISHGKRLDEDASNAQEVELAHVEASSPGGSPQASRTPMRSDIARTSSVLNGRKHVESEITTVKVNGTALYEDMLQGSLGNGEADIGDLSREALVGAEIVLTKKNADGYQEKKQKVKENGSIHLNEVKDAHFCADRVAMRNMRDEVGIEVPNGNVSWSTQCSRGRSCQFFTRDESFALDALQTLANLSLNLQALTCTSCSEPAVQSKEDEREDGALEKFNVSVSMSSNSDRGNLEVLKSKLKGESSKVEVDLVASKGMDQDSSLNSSAASEGKCQNYQVTGKLQKRKRKLSPAKVVPAEVHVNSISKGSQKVEVSTEEEKRSSCETECNKPLERYIDSSLGGTDASLTECTSQASPVNRVNFPSKCSRRKMGLRRVFQKRKPSEIGGNVWSDALSLNVHAHDLKKEISHCFLSKLLRRWCIYEWFYSSIDYPWFAKSEFVGYLNHVGLGHVPRLTRAEWSVIRSSLGKPRRLSKQFLQEEREKLEQYRQSVRAHYAELLAGTRKELATDLALPLSVGQHVIACHPWTREIHDGCVLTIEHSRSRVQFDEPGLGVELIMDVDCMPANPMENMPEAHRRQNFIIDRLRENFDKPEVDKASMWNQRGGMNVSSVQNSEKANGLSLVASSNYSMNTFLRPGKGETVENFQQKPAVNGVLSGQPTYSSPYCFAQIQVRESDIKAFSDQSCAIDSKVSSALLHFRHFNTFLVNSASQLNGKLAPSEGGFGVRLSSFDHSVSMKQQLGSPMIRVVEDSRKKAKTMVHAAMEAVSSLKEGENLFDKIGEAVEFAYSQSAKEDSGLSMTRDSTSDVSHGSSASVDITALSLLESTTVAHALCAKRNNNSVWSELHSPSELISSCVAILLMIQICSQRQHPPAEVAKILDTAITGLQPCCSQNLPVYKGIEECIRHVKHQILALVPTQANIATTELSTM